MSSSSATAEGKPPAEQLNQASSSGDLSQVQKIVEFHAMWTDFDILQMAFGTAVWRGHVETARWFLDNGAEVRRMDVLGAVRQGADKKRSMLELLLDRGWEINKVIGEGGTMLCGVMGDENLVRYLLERGADQNLSRPHVPRADAAPSTTSGRNLDMAAAISTVKIFDLLLAYGARLEDSHPLYAAASGTHSPERVAMMEHLLNLGVDINAQRDPGDYYCSGTALHYAILRCQPDNVRFLIAHGADPGVRNKGGKTAWECAERHGGRILDALREAISSELFE